MRTRRGRGFKITKIGWSFKPITDKANLEEFIVIELGAWVKPMPKCPLASGIIKLILNAPLTERISKSRKNFSESVKAKVLTLCLGEPNSQPIERRAPPGLVPPASPLLPPLPLLHRCRSPLRLVLLLLWSIYGESVIANKCRHVIWTTCG